MNSRDTTGRPDGTGLVRNWYAAAWAAEPEPGQAEPDPDPEVGSWPGWSASPAAEAAAELEVS